LKLNGKTLWDVKQRLKGRDAFGKKPEVKKSRKDCPLTDAKPRRGTETPPLSPMTEKSHLNLIFKFDGPCLLLT
jgi:hypothetical protein